MSDYGYFSEDGTEYIINTPELPRPWMNFSWNDTYLMAIDHTGTGTGQYVLPDKENRMLLIDKRRIYVQDGQNTWNLGYAPVCAEPETYQCRVGLHYSIIEQKNYGIAASWRLFVPIQRPCEIWTVILKNLSNTQKTLKVFPGVNFRIDSYKLSVLPHCTLIDAHCDHDIGILHARNRGHERPIEDYSAFFASSKPFQAFEVISTAAYDAYHGEAWPKFLNNGCTSTEGGDHSNTIGFFEHHISLNPNETVVLEYVVGPRFHLALREQWIQKLFANGQIEREFKHKCHQAKSMIGQINLNTPDKHVNRIANIWCQQQTNLGAKWARIYSLGVRDILQDAQGLMPALSESGQKALLAALKHQNADGSALRSWDPTLSIKASDCQVWISLTLTEYIKETADFKILEKTVPYYDKGQGTVLEHWLGSLDFMYNNRGAHGLCLLFDCDWSDSLTVGHAGRGESVFNTEALIYAMKLSVDLLKHLGYKDMVKKYSAEINELSKICNEVAWDGRWYIRAFNDDGEIIGSSSKPELGEIFLNTQSWAVLAGIVSQEKLALLDEAVEDKLFCEYGYLVSAPGFTDPMPSVGRLSGINLGIYENAGVYCHANMFKVIAEYFLGRYEKAWALAKLMFTEAEFNPQAANCAAEPYAFTNQFMGPNSSFPGRSQVGWITGTASWMNQVLLKYLPGIIPDYDGLKIIPSLPREIGKIHFIRPFRGAFYDIDIALDDTVLRGDIQVKFNGQNLKKPLIPVAAKDSHNQVTIRYSPHCKYD